MSGPALAAPAACSRCVSLAAKLADAQRLVRLYALQARKRADLPRCADCGAELAADHPVVRSPRCPDCQRVRAKLRHRDYMREWQRNRRAARVREPRTPYDTPAALVGGWTRETLARAIAAELDTSERAEELDTGRAVQLLRASLRFLRDDRPRAAARVVLALVATRNAAERLAAIAAHPHPPLTRAQLLARLSSARRLLARSERALRRLVDWDTRDGWALRPESKLPRR